MRYQNKNFGGTSSFTGVVSKDRNRIEMSNQLDCSLVSIKPIVCKVVDSESFDKIEKKAGRKIFFGDLARKNLSTIMRVGDLLLYGDQKVAEPYTPGVNWILRAATQSRPSLVFQSPGFDGGKPSMGVEWRVNSTVSTVHREWGDIQYSCK